MSNFVNQNQPKITKTKHKDYNIKPNTCNKTPNIEYDQKQYTKKEKASRFGININCPHRELASLPLFVLIFFGVLGAVCFLVLCLYLVVGITY